MLRAANKRVDVVVDTKSPTVSSMGPSATTGDLCFESSGAAAVVANLENSILDHAHVASGRGVAGVAFVRK